jgi:excisionase family DNA binding protein
LEPERLLTVKEVAERLGVCAATVYRPCANGELRHLRVLKSIRVSATELRAFTSQPECDSEPT